MQDSHLVEEDEVLVDSDDEEDQSDHSILGRIEKALTMSGKEKNYKEVTENLDKDIERQIKLFYL